MGLQLRLGRDTSSALRVILHPSANSLSSRARRPQKSTDAEGPDREAEAGRVAMEHVAQDDRAERDQWSAQQARDEHGEQGAAQLRLAHHFANAIESLKAGSAARVGPVRDRPRGGSGSTIRPTGTEHRSPR